MKQLALPLLDALEKYSKEKVVRFHMPGHKGDIDPTARIARLFGSDIFRYDVTNIPEMDNLHQPKSVILEAERLAAQAFGADRTYFLINGSSCGLQALIMTVCNPGDRLLVPRNIHRSILGGIILGGVVPVYYLPCYNPEFGIPLGCSLQTIEQQLIRQSLKGVIVVNPTYHGITSDISELANVAHKYDVPLLVDEAHGPHLRFHEDLPLSALEQGADGVVHGTHKLLTSFTQASMVHTKGHLIDKNRLEAVLRIIQSTSTSYLLLASLDAARQNAAINGRAMISSALERSSYISRLVNSMYGLKTLGTEIIGNCGVHGIDLTKVTICFRQLGLSGYQVESILRDTYNIQVEMADLFNILLLITSGNTSGDMKKIAVALEQLTKMCLKIDKPTSLFNNDVLIYPEIPEMVLSPRDAFFSPVTFSSLDKAAGRISAEIITCYPPGVPIIGPGEKITQDIVDYIRVLKATGASFQGCNDPSLENILVVC